MQYRIVKGIPVHNDYICTPRPPRNLCFPIGPPRYIYFQVPPLLAKPQNYIITMNTLLDWSLRGIRRTKRMWIEVITIDM